MYGVTPSGFTAKPFDAIKKELEEAYRATFGSRLKLTPQSVAGQEIAIIADRLTDLWQLAEAVYLASWPDSATGVSLDYVASITGTARRGPTFTRVLATCSGTPGTVLAAGRVASIGGVHRFETVAPATIGAGGSVDVEFVAQAFGPTPCYAGTLDTIETPTAGWAGVVNAADHFVLGRNTETDAELRLRREEELLAQGSASTEAIRQRVLKVPGVLECYVFENVADVVNADGIPAHSIEVLVEGGDDQAIREAIAASKAGGIGTHGTVEGTVTDSQGVTHEIAFSRPILHDVWVTVNVLEVDAQALPADAANQIAEAVATFGNRLRIGHDVISSAILPSVFRVSGLLDVALPLIGLAPSPSGSSTLVMSLRERARLDTSRVTVNLP